MAVIVLTDGVFTLNSVDLTDHCTDIMLDIGGKELDISTITDDWEAIAMGRKFFTVQYTLLDDFAASKTDATMWGAFNTGTAVPFTFKATSGAIAATNPEWQGNILPSKSPVGGTGGEMLKKSVTWKGTGAITRDVTP